MRRLTELAHDICRQVLKPGDVAVDATVGNGYDTLFLAQTVGAAGRVYGFDVQPEAVEQTRAKLKQFDDDRVTLIHGNHAEMETSIPTEQHGRIKLIMFNLGYLPGGYKEITTQTETTIPALEASCRILANNGLISIIAYPGHEGGADETSAVETLLQQKQSEGWNVKTHVAVEANPTAPRLYLLSRIRS